MTLPPILGSHFELRDYPESLQTEAIERSISASLPPIDGLAEAGLSEEQRVQVFASAAAAERRAFIQVHGDPFGSESSQDQVHEQINIIQKVLVGA